jgi:hypothetical protein
MISSKPFVIKTAFAIVCLLAFCPNVGLTQDQTLKKMVYDPGHLKPVDSELKVAVGDPAPQFSLPSLTGEAISLDQYKDTHNVVISFVPAAWTPVCSDQWPAITSQKTFLRSMMQSFWGLALIICPPCMHGPNKWVNSGSGVV